MASWLGMPWEVEGTDRFAAWFTGLSEEEQVDGGRIVELLVEHGPALPFPYSSGVSRSQHRHMRELRVQHAGRPHRVLYAFDPRRTAILRLGGDKTAQDRWYEEDVQIADALYDKYLETLKRKACYEASHLGRHQLYIGTLKMFAE